MTDLVPGGISFFSQRHGWSCDTVQEFEVVLANSSIVRATENSNADLFWALRGGGANFGVVTSVSVDVFPQGPSWYNFQLFNLGDIKSVMQRLDYLTRNMPTDLQMIATNLAWSPWRKEFVLSDRIVSLSENVMETMQMDTNAYDPCLDTPLPAEEHLYRRTTFEMAQVMDIVNEDGFFNFFGSMTVKSGVEINLIVADIFQEEASKITNIPGIQVYIVYNPLTTPTIKKMTRRGGNTLRIQETDGPLTIINFNMRWSQDADTTRMREFLRRTLRRVKDASEKTGTDHPYLFLNHCYEEQTPLLSYGAENIKRLHRIREDLDPDGVFQTLKVGQHKLGRQYQDAVSWSGKTEL
ncbi:hypothetical protein PFICI_08675 [Pestalotiopsis fici W106-1]|uniref:FAD-binding PCMH-type domain-containing protein n=1 Tax=Pestalotiopsis fici (strain W106-1 / CGMCC3.15140) TaxID=1229662 RepID=W3X0E0_PESFW|nr:uncharacterized protein PFICI_08675 [Pestalotiopsis fici W106-1]ETS78822.1 hypothetical protein PFICI_08675 [Pestalotiopsis fici W106-1]